MYDSTAIAYVEQASKCKFNVFINIEDPIRATIPYVYTKFFRTEKRALYVVNFINKHSTGSFNDDFWIEL